jgi:hypothetical protein
MARCMVFCFDHSSTRPVHVGSYILYILPPRSDAPSHAKREKLLRRHEQIIRELAVSPANLGAYSSYLMPLTGAAYNSQVESSRECC